MSVRIIIDCDPMIYKTGAIGEQRTYQLVFESPTGKLLQRQVKPPQDVREVKKAAAEKGYELLYQDMLITPGPASLACHAINQMMQATIREAGKKFSEDAEVIPLLGGPGNFRYQIATLSPYKAKRAYKPYHYQTLRDYLCEHWDARVISGREADDECSILQREFHEDGVKSIVCSTDKDLDQIPGWHYDYHHKVTYRVREDDALVFFYEQAMSGDPTDTIPGVQGIGPAIAKKRIASVTEEHGVSEEAMWGEVVQVYADKGVKGVPEGEWPERAEEMAIETARLVKMQDYRGQLWSPPGQEDELLEETGIDG